ncbi:prohibitin family protein [Candidatus Roizmanbacteria bacterium]|nr:prohibitin family protein [Candidatus Roizmanbacteria bacterium]
MNTKLIVGALGVFAGIVIIAIVNPFYTVGAGERGIIVRLGKVQSHVYGEGMHLRQPLTDEVVLMSVRVKKDEFNELTAASRDLQTVTTKVAVNWHLNANTIDKIYQQIGREEDVTARIISPNVSEVVKAATAQRTAEELLTKRPQLKDEIDKNLSERLAQYNVIVDDVSITDLDFAADFNRAVEAKARAEQEALAEKNNLEKVKYQAQQKIETAKADAESIRIQGEALEKNPKLVELKAVEKWNGILPAQMLGNSVPFINVSR